MIFFPSTYILYVSTLNTYALYLLCCFVLLTLVISNIHFPDLLMFYRSILPWPVSLLETLERGLPDSNQGLVDLIDISALY